uniref:Pectinesterase inhibitor domain-containing protein n=1 Tax=Arundo donax TaxID=35708 RepID=A0A0A9FI83_ARUDO
MPMRPPSPTARLLAAAALAVATLALSTGGAGATVVTTCRAAANSDARVDYGFCVAELGKHRDSPDADTWGLAKVAALTGVVNSDDAVYDIKAMLAKPGAGGSSRAALGQCQKIYDSVGFAFAEAEDSINNRDYAAGKGKAAEAALLARQCDGALAKAGAAPSPLAQYSSYSVKIAIICTAITNLIK